MPAPFAVELLPQDPATGRRLVQLHFYAAGAPDIGRHVAFRDHPNARPDVARACEAEKQRCRGIHSGDSHAYSDCKSAWIRRFEREALAWAGRGR